MALTKVTGELVDIGDLDISNVGSIQLDSIAGDADSNTSITFSGSDVITVATGGSTAATFNADQTTTFSGAISGTSATFTTADNTDTLSLISTDADANQGPILNLYRNSSSPADSDSLGRITFDGKNDAGEVVEYARVFSKILDASDGTEDGTFTINRMVAGTSRAIMTAIESETVFNEASQDIDFRIESDGNANMFFLDASANKIYIGDNASHTDDFLQIETPASGGGHGIQIRRNDSNTDQGIGRILFGNNTDTDLVQIHAKTDGANDNGALIFSTQPDGGSLTERMRITHDGDVGIGTTSPSTKLHLEDSSADSIVQLTWKNDARDWRLGVHGGVSDSLVLYDNTASATRMVVDSSGKLGIGTTSPSHKVEVSDGAVASKYDADHHVAIRGLSGGQYIQYDSANPLEFVSVDTYPNSGATSRARLTTNGHWLVGTTSSTINSSNFGGVIFSDGRPKFSKNVDGGSHVMNVYGNAGEMRVFGDGDVINTNNSYGQISDVSLKENIVDASSKLADINKVKVRNFNFKGNDLKQIGVVAQELETVFPALVTTDEEDDDIKTVKYSVFVPILIKALQEADDKIDALEARIATLESS